MLSSPFDLVVDGIGYRLDPRRIEGLGPVLTLYPGAARWLCVTEDGRLTLMFEHSARLEVRPGGPADAWAVEVGVLATVPLA